MSISLRTIEYMNFRNNLFRKLDIQKLRNRTTKFHKLDALTYVHHTMKENPKQLDRPHTCQPNFKKPRDWSVHCGTQHISINLVFQESNRENSCTCSTTRRLTIVAK